MSRRRQNGARPIEDIVQLHGGRLSMRPHRLGHLHPTRVALVILVDDLQGDRRQCRQDDQQEEMPAKLHSVFLDEARHRACTA